MKQTLELRVGQHLTMTPQLQQAIRLLQLSSIELQQEVQNTLDSNVMLETEEEGQLRDTGETPDLPINNTATAETFASGTESEATQEDPIEERELDPEHTNLSDEWPIDSDWGDSYENYALNGTNQNEYAGDNLAQQSHSETLRDHLFAQLNLVTCPVKDRIIATAIIDAINEDGYLSCTLEEIITDFVDLNPLISEAESVLRMVQAFDPSGVAARNLRECLLIQLQQLQDHTQICRYAQQICTHHFQLLDSQNHTVLKAATHITDENLHAVIALLRTLYPYPGRKIATQAPQYLVPDILVSRRRGMWHTELNSELIPRVRINHDYAKLIRRVDRSADNAYLKNHLQEARWFIKNLANRNETMLRVATKIVELQRNFFEHGPEAMLPLVLRDIAEALDMHESTVSRVTSQKYLYCPRGTFELKFFFPSHVSTDTGGQCSATAIQALIKKLIATEPTASPLSDDMLAKRLAEQGIKVARRTIAKYRESMGIASSSMRKRSL